MMGGVHFLLRQIFKTICEYLLKSQKVNFKYCSPELYNSSI